MRPGEKQRIEDREQWWTIELKIPKDSGQRRIRCHGDETRHVCISGVVYWCPLCVHHICEKHYTRHKYEHIMEEITKLGGGR